MRIVANMRDNFLFNRFPNILLLIVSHGSVFLVDYVTEFLCFCMYSFNEIDVWSFRKIRIQFCSTQFNSLLKIINRGPFNRSSTKHGTPIHEKKFQNF